MAALTMLRLPGEPDAWHALGFQAADGAIRVGNVTVAIPASVASWGFDELHDDPGSLGVYTEVVDPPRGEPSEHANRVERIDHVVYLVPALEEAMTAIGEVLGLEVRKRFRPRESGPEMAFYRSGEVVLEVVDAAAGPALWGVALRTPDLDATVDAVRGAGGRIGEPKPAVQGGRIATVPQGHLGFPLAFMEPAARRFEPEASRQEGR